MADLTGRIAIITGAKGGLGTYVTRAFLNAGATVAGVSRSISQGDFDHPRFSAIPAEIGSQDQANAVVARVVEQFNRVDVIVHLMGSWAGGALLENTTAEQFGRMIDVNLGSTFYVMSAGARAMRPRGSGRLLAIASKAALEPQPQAGAYSVSKAAVVALIRGFAAETRDTGITANAVLPGTMDTPQNRAAMPGADPSKWVHPCQVAELLVYLASDAAASVSGAAIPIYGADV